ncbi:alcohol dehydrogenase [Halieaceae bacterium IMCC14734]|uniref:Alcohol dehydrogenase n=1 Tax=Candidatus Litorirhabdus singularis TaxID=2518993 RepID=A0ABT3TDQ0_9GAMM|nr:zinc-binding dehydrogenase [Candidatus Litorirhabdus singularis]MCX2980119.1 alcohol dehydrogenase [Candidatus Litorirhabdus singularis]
MPTMSQVRIHGVDDVRIDTVPVPVAGPDDVVIDVAACGICGSDLGYIAMGGLTPPGQPMPLGHELAGIVAQCGANVSHLQLGQRVVVNPTSNGTDIGNGGPEGGFAPQLLVTAVAQHPDTVLPLPDSLSFQQGALVEPLAVATHGINQGQAVAGDKVLVFGAGPIGLCTVMALRYRGIDNIFVADQSAQRLDLARQLGANATCQVPQQHLLPLLQEQQGGSSHYGMPVADTDLIIEATGVGAVLEQCISLARPGARIVVVGVHKAPIPINPLDLLMKELHLIGSMAYPHEFPAVIAMLSSGILDTSVLISHEFVLDEFDTALKTAMDRDAAAKVMINIASL